MKAKATRSHTAAAANVAFAAQPVELAIKKLWLPIIFGASLFYLSHPAEAREQQGTSPQTLQSADTRMQSRSGGVPTTQKQGAGRGTKPHPEYSGTQPKQGSVQRYRNLVSGDEPEVGQGMNQGTASGQNTNRGVPPARLVNQGTTSGRNAPGGQGTPRDTTFDTEKMNSGPAPHTENINQDTVSPGGDNMMRDAIPGGSGLNR